MKKITHNISILDVDLSVFTYEKTLAVITEYIRKRKKGYVCVSAVHLLVECQKNEYLRRGVNNAALVTPDGMPLVWIARRRGLQAERVYGPALMLKTCALAQQKAWKIFLIGGATGQSQQLRSVLLQKYPALHVVGRLDTPTLPLSEKENAKAINAINATQANIVYIGMGCPTQELWMIKNRASLSPQILIGVGAAFDFLTGKKRQAPAYMQIVGLEWFYRLIQEPKRLWYRYIVQNVMFLGYLALFGVYGLIHNKNRS